MAQKLLDYYAQAQKMGGLKAKLRLAILTRIPSPNAAKEPDSPENISKFTSAMAEIRKEFN